MARRRASSAAEEGRDLGDRRDVPASQRRAARLWDDLLQRASARIDVLVHAGQFLHERPGFIATLKAKAEAGVAVRIAFGAPESEATERRSAEEKLGLGVLGARIRYGLVSYRPLLHTAGVEFRFHETTLYNSIFRFDDEMIVNMHVYGVPGPHAPAMHLRKLAAGDLFDDLRGQLCRRMGAVEAGRVVAAWPEPTTSTTRTLLDRTASSSRSALSCSTRTTGC